MSISQLTASLPKKGDEELIILLQTRFYVALRRASGRTIDLVWFQQNKEYAQAVLDFADTIVDKELKEITRQLRFWLS